MKKKDEAVNISLTLLEIKYIGRCMYNMMYLASRYDSSDDLMRQHNSITDKLYMATEKIKERPRKPMMIQKTDI